MCGVPPAGTTPLYDAAALREADAATIAAGTPGQVLMERAGLAASRAVLAAFPPGSRALVLAGPGNNGGDGMVVARHLAEAGWDVRVALPGGRRPATPDAEAMTALVEAMGIPMAPADPAAIAGDDAVVIDAMLGTGTGGAPRGDIADVVRAVVASGAPVVALDVPTGVDADTGQVPGDALRACLTITFAGDMPGLHVMPGRAHAGRVVVADIGVPRHLQPDPVALLADDGAIAGIPRRDQADDKYRAGSVVLVAGSPGMSGAARLSSRAALRAGAGIVIACVPPSVHAEVAAHTPEVMVTGCDRDEVERQVARATAVGLGPGLGREEATTGVVRDLLGAIDRPLVLDADGLWHLGDDLALLRGRPAPTVITPHSGEAARLLGTDRAKVDAARLDAAGALAERSGQVALLKGPGTIVAAPGELPVVLATGTQVLATAGSGDVLTGVIAALLARGMDARDAAVAGAALHARAGVLADRGDGTIAGDIIECLPEAHAA